MQHRIFLGTIERCGQVYIGKHEWACDWYWGFGYLGNTRCHFHINSLIDHPVKHSPNWTDVTEQFDTTWLTQAQWWILRDLFIQAYAFRKAADCYVHGGHQSALAEKYRFTSKRKAKMVNRDLEKVLDTIWALLAEWADTK